MPIDSPRLPRAAWMLASVLCLAAAGCDAGPTGPAETPPPAPVETGFEPAEAAEAMGEVTSPPPGSLAALRQLRLAGTALADAGAGLVLEALSVAPGLPAAPSGLAATFSGSTAAILASLAEDGNRRAGRAYGRVVGLAVAETVFPPVLLGKTFVWDSDDRRYVVHPTRRGAPANGLRFLLYEADPQTGEPASSRVVGHLDLTDESDGPATRLAVRAVGTGGGASVVLLDYVVEGEGGLDGSDFVVGLRASGFISDGTERMEFEFAEELGFGHDFQSVRLSIDNRIAVPSREVSARVVIDGQSTGASSEATLEVTLESGPDAIVLSVESTDTHQAGTLSYNGETVVLVQGSSEQPIFTDAAGNALGVDEVESLRELWDAVDALLGVAEEILSPLADLLTFEVV